MALSTLLVTAIASMSAPPIDVAGDRRCLDAAALEARAQSWGAREAWPDGVTAHVEHTDATLTIRVDASGAEPMVRTFDAVPEACHDVELMAAVAIAMALDAVEQAATPPSADVARVDAAPVRPIPTVTLHDTAWSVRPARPVVALSIALGGAQGLVPFATAVAVDEVAPPSGSLPAVPARGLPPRARPVASRVAASSPTAASAPEQAPSVDDRIAREAAQIRQIRRDLAEGRAATALRSCDAGDDEFHDGVFALERQGLRVLSLFALGRRDEATSAATRYLGTHPKGPLAAKIRAAAAD